MNPCVPEGHVSLLRPFSVLLKMLPEGTNIHEIYVGLNVFSENLFCVYGFLDGKHATDRGTVGSIGMPSVPGPDTLNPRYLLGRFPASGADNLASGGAVYVE